MWHHYAVWQKAVSVYLPCMMPKKRWVVSALLFLISILIHLFSLNTGRVEAYYSEGLFPAIAATLRFLFGWLPFSLGDLIYAAIVLFLIYKMVKFGKRPWLKMKWRPVLLNFLNFILALYICFNMLWGLNYNRTGVLNKFGIEEAPYSKEDLISLNQLLLEKVNSSKSEWINKGSHYPSNREVFRKVFEAYKIASLKYPFLSYKPISLKPSIWSLAGNYLGFTGYYNPFTGEAQVNTTTPKFLQPYTACHEVAHQIGYAKEMEANFVGFIAADQSPDPLLRYSTYLDLFFYANRNLYNTDSILANDFRKNLTEPVQKDIAEWRLFRLKHRSVIEPVFRWAYGKFLERNEQPQGIMAYDEVTSYVIAFYKKQKEILH